MVTFVNDPAAHGDTDGFPDPRHRRATWEAVPGVR